MTDPPPPPVSETPAPLTAASAVPAQLPMQQRDDGTLVIDLMPLAALPQECARDEPDPFNAEIVVCRETGSSPRIGPAVGPEDDGFGSAIPRARIKLSDNTAAEANVIKEPVGGVDADGAEVRLKIDF